MPRNPMSLVLHQARYDLQAVRADRQARFTTLFMPILLLVVIIAVTGKGPIHDGAAMLTPATFYAPGVIAFAVLASSLMSLVVDLVVQRETGVLKRRRARPIPPWTLVAARILVAIGTSLAVSIVVLFVAGNGYDAHIPAAAVPAVIVLVTAGAASLSAIAYALSTFIRSSSAAQPVIALITLPLYLVSGIFFPASKLPSLLDGVAQAFPLEHLAHGLRHALVPGAGALPVDGLDIAVLAAWTLVGAGVALWRFQWLPRAR
jgi:ABC-2 type transport system permease protein